MNRHILESAWNHARAFVQVKWSNLTNDDLGAVTGKPDGRPALALECWENEGGHLANAARHGAGRAARVIAREPRESGWRRQPPRLEA